MRWDANNTHPGGYTFLSESAGSGSTGPIYFRMGTNDAVSILANSNVGIGTTNPNNLFQVNGILKVGGAVNQQTGMIALGDDLSAASYNGIYIGSCF